MNSPNSIATSSPQTTQPIAHIRRGVYAHWKRQAAAGRKIVAICAWCANPAAHALDGQVTHGMCARCFQKLTGGAK
jgi:hypothetical protein